MNIDHSLKTRAKSAVIFGVIVLGLIYLGGIPFALLMGAASAIGVYEWLRMMKHEKTWRWPFTLFGLAYIGAACCMMIKLRTGATGGEFITAEEKGLFNMLMLLGIVWGSDICAYFTGRTLGGPKLAPKISPKKTWSGFIGSSVGAALIAAPLAQAFHFSPMIYGQLAFVLAMFGQAGDLLISIFKRRYGVKDTGTIMPGHGGVLDRIDALMLVSLIFGALELGVFA